MKKLKDYDNSDVAEFEIIDEWTKQYVETLGRDEALKKYGDCDVYGTYTSKCVPYKGFAVDVWLMIPGDHIYDQRGHRITIDAGRKQFTERK